MNYKAVYDAIIGRAIKRDFYSKKYRIGTNKTEIYTEVHHIMPKCMGGTNDTSNLAVLTAREHFLCHLLLCKIFPQENKLLAAFSIMANRTPGKKAKLYSIYKERYAISLTGRKHSYEYKRKKSEFMLIKGKDPLYRQKVSEGVKKAFDRDPTIKERISDALKNNYKNEEYREKVSRAIKLSWDNTNRREEMSKRVRIQNTNNPTLKEIRLSAIRDHQMTKSDEWKNKCSVWTKRYMNKPEVKEFYRNKIKGGKNPVARKVINISTGKIYDCAVDAAVDLDINLSTLKKWLYKNVAKHNCLWYDYYQEVK